MFYIVLELICKIVLKLYTGSQTLIQYPCNELNGLIGMILYTVKVTMLHGEVEHSMVHESSIILIQICFQIVKVQTNIYI